MTFPAGCELNLIKTIRSKVAFGNRSRRILIRETSGQAAARIFSGMVQTVGMANGILAAGVLLAAGAGTRYGMPKVLADDGQWLRAGVAALALGGCGDGVGVLGAAIVDAPAPARVVVASDWADGLSASLRAGLRAVD